MAAPMPRAAPVTIATRWSLGRDSDMRQLLESKMTGRTLPTAAPRRGPPRACERWGAGGPLSDALEQGGQALPAADAHRLQPVAGLAVGHLPGQRGQDAPAGGTHRVAQGDARAVDVGALEVRVGEAP